MVNELECLLSKYLRIDMEVQRVNAFGGSLPVANVQALASKNLKNIPSRYVRTEAEQVVPDGSLCVPVIDMNKLMDDQVDELGKLHMACKEWGFFQLINHGVREDLIEKMRHDVEAFFRLPLETKSSYAQPPNSIEGYGQAFVVSEEQKLDWGDMLFLITQPQSIRNLRLWPTTPNSFQETMDNYSKQLQRVTVTMLRFFAKNLELAPETFAKLFEDGVQGIRMNYYPPCQEANKAVGLSPHSDATGLTLLLQVNEIEGLQIRKNGTWIQIKPVNGAFIVNVGDMIEIMSNGTYRSIEHRAVVNENKERLSIAAFHSPSLATRIGPLPEISQENAKYRTLDHGDYIKFISSCKLDGKSQLGKMKLV